MSRTLLVQSHSMPLSTDWLQICIDSVKHWAELNKIEYRCIDDELFDYISAEALQKTRHQKVIATDLARLKVLQSLLSQGYETVIWCDADFIIFNKEKFKLADESYSLGREVWIQKNSNKPGKLSAHIKVHNAFMMFRKGNTFLEFYIETAEKLLLRNTGKMSPQFIGPKLLTALHNVVQCPVLESAGMLSPLVVKDIAIGGGEALKLFIKKSSHSIYAANVCNSMYECGEYSTETIKGCLSALMANQEL